MSMFYSKSTGGFYDDSLHETIPSDAVGITVAQWQALLAGQASGQLIVADSNGNPILETAPGPTLAQAQATGLVQIDAAAEELRALAITASPGQVATYILKYNEATAFQTANYAGTVPALVQSEMTATGATAQAATTAIIAQYTSWASLAASIETVRRSNKVAVNAATTVAAVTSAVTAATTGYAGIKSAAGL